MVPGKYQKRYMKSYTNSAKWRTTADKRFASSSLRPNCSVSLCGFLNPQNVIRNRADYIAFLTTLSK